jgi:hypothetical protein
MFFNVRRFQMAPKQIKTMSKSRAGDQIRLSGDSLNTFGSFYSRKNTHFFGCRLCCNLEKMGRAASGAFFQQNQTVILISSATIRAKFNPDTALKTDENEKRKRGRNFYAEHKEICVQHIDI